MSGITIKSPADIQKMEVAGRIVEDTLNLLSQTATAGMTTAELDDLASAFIKSRGAETTRMAPSIWAAPVIMFFT